MTVRSKPVAPLLPLSLVLAADAASCAAMGVGLLALGNPLAGLTGLPPLVLAVAGWILLPVAALIAFVAARPAPHPALLALIVAGNAGWVMASIILLAVAPMNVLGAILVVGQGLAVAVFTALEARALPALRAARA